MREIRIREMHYEEAMRKLESELQDAFLQGERQVSVLHGIGTGTLKKMTARVVSESGFAELVRDQGLYRNPGVTLVNLHPPGNHRLKQYIR